MFLGDKTTFIALWIAKLMAPCLVAYLKNSQNPLIRDMDGGKKSALIALAQAVNGSDQEAKAAMKAAEAEVKKIQGGE